jgi:hypothetical protein
LFVTSFKRTQADAGCEGVSSVDTGEYVHGRTVLLILFLYTPFHRPPCDGFYEGLAGVLQVIDINSLEVQKELDELLTGVQPEGYRCDVCGQSGQVITRCVITSLPYCLCFAIHGPALKKTMCKQLVLQEYSNCVYNLSAVSLHRRFGQLKKAEANAGHYVTIFCNARAYYVANDDRVWGLSDARFDRYMCPQNDTDFIPYLAFYIIDPSCVDQLAQPKHSGSLLDVVNAISAEHEA